MFLGRTFFFCLNFYKIFFKDYEAGRLKEAKDDEYAITSEDDEVAKKELPFNCFICRDSFKNPVVTK